MRDGRTGATRRARDLTIRATALLLALVVLGPLASPASAQQGDDQGAGAPVADPDARRIERVLADRVPRLASDDFAERAAAQEAIAALGVEALPRIREALEATGDPEVRGRLRAIVATLVPAEIEVYALGRIAADLPFPEPQVPPRELTVPSRLDFGRVPAAEALAEVAPFAGVPVVVHPDDEGLAARLETTPLTWRSTSTKPRIEWVIRKIAYSVEATCVIDADRVVLVSMTPRILEAELALLPGPRWPGSLAEALGPLDPPRRRHALEYLGGIARRGDGRIDAIRARLRRTVLDPSRPEAVRVGALKGFARCLAYPTPDPAIVRDIDGLMATLAIDERTPAGLRAVAVGHVARGSSRTAQRTVVEILEGTTTARRMEMMVALENGRALRDLALRRDGGEDADLARRLDAALVELSTKPEAEVVNEAEHEAGGDDEVARDLATIALVHRAWRGDDTARALLVDRAEPESWDALRFWLRELSGDVLRTTGTNPAENETRFREFQEHGSARVRALYLHLAGARPYGNADRSADAEKALAMLEDPAVEVRWLAAGLVGRSFTTRFAPDFVTRPNLERGRRAIAEAIENETDARVAERLDGVARSLVTKD